MRFAVFGFLVCMSAAAQEPAFEVASIKPSAPQGGGRSMIRMQGGPGTGDPGRISYTGVPLKLLLTNAYNVKDFQVVGPSWMESERFDVTAKVPPGTTKEQSRVMMQNLLAERFHITLHRESKEVQGFEMTAAKGGPKLKEPAPAPEPEGAPAGPMGPPKRDANGFAKLQGPGLMMMMEMTPKGPIAKMSANSQPLSELVRMLSNQLKKPVIDKTGLTGKYDFQMEFAPDLAGMQMPPPPGGGPPPAPSEDGGPDILTALKEQLGLKLDARKLPVDILVIDKADKTPAEN